MRIAFCAWFALMLGSNCHAAAAALPEALVAKIEEKIPLERLEANRFIWQRFSKKEREAEIPDFRLSEWEAQRDKYVAALIDRAKSAGLEADRLAMILKKMDAERGSLAILPLEAYQAVQGDRGVWVVFCRWEIAEPKSRSEARIGHQRVFAYDISTLERVAYETCL